MELPVMTTYILPGIS